VFLFFFFLERAPPLCAPAFGTQRGLSCPPLLFFFFDHGAEFLSPFGLKRGAPFFRGCRDHFCSCFNRSLPSFSSVVLAHYPFSFFCGSPPKILGAESVPGLFTCKFSSVRLKFWALFFFPPFSPRHRSFFFSTRTCRHPSVVFNHIPLFFTFFFLF